MLLKEALRTSLRTGFALCVAPDIHPPSGNSAFDRLNSLEALFGSGCIFILELGFLRIFVFGI
ncbi:MAG: hypothetical protein RR743_06460, partial [Oscillospiraceae bacterium]